MKRTKYLAITALVVMFAIVGYVAFSDIEKNLVYYLSPDDLVKKAASANQILHTGTLRLGGVVQKHSVDFDKQTLVLHFRVGMQEEGGVFVDVETKSTPPQMFQEGIGAVVEGAFDGRVFHAERVLVKHSNEYRPPAPHEKPQHLYQTLIDTAL